jgi:signal transduction histidine kinase
MDTYLTALFFIPPLLSAALLPYIWQRRVMPGAWSLIALSSGLSWWGFSYALELLVGDNLPLKVNLAGIKYLGIVVVPIAWLSFTLAYSNRPLRPKLQWVALLVFLVEPVIVALMALTNEQHGLLWTNARLASAGLLVTLKVDYQPIFWIHTVYSYALLFAGTQLILITLLNSPGLYRRQSSLLLLAVLTPWLANALSVFKIGPFANLDITSIAFSAAAYLLILGLARFQFMNVLPIAHTTVIARLDTGLVVVNHDGQVIDMNPAAAEMLALDKPAIGRPIAQLAPKLMAAGPSPTTIDVERDGKRLVYEIYSTKLDDSGHSQPRGTIITLRNVTSRIAAERALRESEEHYRSVVTAMSGGVLVYDRQGRLTTCNAAAVRILGLSYEQIARASLSDPGWPAIDEDGSPYPPGEFPAFVTLCTGQPLRGKVIGIEWPDENRTTWISISTEAIFGLDADQPEAVLVTFDDITSRKRAEERSASFATLAKKLNLVTSPTEVARSVAEAADSFWRWDAFALTLRDPNTNMIQPVLYVATLDQQRQEIPTTELVLRPGPLSMQIMQDGQQVITLDSQPVLDGDLFSPDGIARPTTSLMMVPIHNGTETTGFLSVQSYQENAYSTTSLNTLQALADQVGGVLDRIRATEELASQKRLFEQLVKVARATTSQPELNATLQNVLDIATILTGTDRGSLVLVNAKGQVSHSLVTSGGLMRDKRRQWASETLTEGLAGWVARFRQPALIDDVTLDERWLDIPGNLPAGSSLSVPIITGSNLVGVLTLVHSETAHFTQNHLRLIQSAADQIALAIRNAQLYESLRSSVADLTVLYRVFQVSSRSLLLREILTQTLATTVTTLDFDFGMIVLLDSNTDRLTVAASHKVPESVVQHFREHGLDGTLAAYVARKQQSVVIPNVTHVSGPEIAEMVSDFDRFGIQAVSSMPLIHQGKSLGAACFYRQEAASAGQVTPELLEAIGNLLAAAVANARLHMAVAQQHTQLQTLISAIRDGIVFISNEAKILVINEAALRLLRLSGEASQWINQPLLTVVQNLEQQTTSADQSGLAQLRRSWRSDDPVSDGTIELPPFFIRWYNLPVIDGQTPSGRLLLLHDVTEDRLLAKARSDLTRTMVHDLRNPLSVIQGLTEALITDAKAPPDQQSILSRIEQTSHRMLNLVNAILDVGRLEAGQMPLNYQAFVLFNLVSDSVDMQAVLAERKGITLHNNIPKGLPLAWADPDLVARILENLLGNAIKFTAPGGQVTITAEAVDTSAPTSEAQTMLQVGIQDTGPGIADDVRPHLFQKFATGRESGRGSGLGLAFARLVVEAHGGQIDVQSEPEHGSVFRFTLPTVSFEL